MELQRRRDEVNDRPVVPERHGEHDLRQPSDRRDAGPGASGIGRPRPHGSGWLVFLEAYLSELVFPALRRSGHVHLPDEQLFERGSLSTLAPELRANSRLYVMHSSDAFLARPEDLEALRSWLGDRLYLYPRGGHLGNLWFGKNREDLRHIMAAAAKP
jgi:hypothetical protein